MPWSFNDLRLCSRGTSDCSHIKWIGIIQLFYSVAMIVLSALWIRIGIEGINDADTSQQIIAAMTFYIEILSIVILTYLADSIVAIFLIIGETRSNNSASYLFAWLVTYPLTTIIRIFIYIFTHITVLQGTTLINIVYLGYSYIYIGAYYLVVKDNNDQPSQLPSEENGQQEPLLTSTTSEHETNLLSSDQNNYGSLLSQA